MTIDNACFAAGICRKTYYLWSKQGKNDAENGIESLQHKLYDELPMAKALLEWTHLKNIKNASKTDWKASAWYLEHTRPERYARRKPIPEKDMEKNDEIRMIG